MKQTAKKPTKAEMRVLIAKDVLKGLRTKKLVPAQGMWARVELSKKTLELLLKAEEALDAIQLKDLLDKGSVCRVCGVGAMFIATVQRTNAFTVSSYDFHGDGPKYTSTYNPRDFAPYLAKYFSVRDIVRIEVAFERGMGAITPDYDGTIPPSAVIRLFEVTEVNLRESTYSRYSKGFDARNILAALAFGNKHKSAIGRMRAIMRNIVKNKGEFLPPPVKA